MYEKFFGFSEKPFNTSPDSRFFFSGSRHLEALNGLIYAIEERKGFVVITGDIGAGKTTICRTLINKLDRTAKVALITNTLLTPRELIAAILEEFKIEIKSGSKQKMLSQLNRYLLDQLAARINVVLIIDEAQNLSPRDLEEVRMLSNLETDREKLIQIILFGQPQLKDKLEHTRLEQFRQRIAFHYFIGPLQKEEAREYILHRLKFVTAVGAHSAVFPEESLELMYQHTRGIPRLINLFCDSALLSGYVQETRTITAQIVAEVARERELNRLPEYTLATPCPYSPDSQTVDVLSATAHLGLHFTDISAGTGDS